MSRKSNKFKGLSALYLLGLFGISTFDYIMKEKGWYGDNLDNNWRVEDNSRQKLDDSVIHDRFRDIPRDFSELPYRSDILSPFVD